MSDADVTELLRRYCGAWKAGDREGWLDTFAADAVQEDPVGSVPNVGRAAIGRFWDDAVAGYDSVDLRMRNLYVAGHEAVLEWTIDAIAADRRRVFDGVDVVTLTDGPLISSVRAFWATARPWTPT